MKTIALCMILASPMIVGITTAAEKLTSVSEVAIEGKEVQKELQNLYLTLKKDTKASSANKEIMTALQDYNIKLHALTYEAEEKAQFTKKKWEELDNSLATVDRLASLHVTAIGKEVRSSLNQWLQQAKSYGEESEKIAVLSTTTSSPSANRVNIGAGGIIHRSDIEVEDFSLGLDTPEDRVEFVEWLTKVRADENRTLVRGGFTTPGGTTNRFPAAYTYSNGSFGNTTTQGRRDTLTPLFNNSTPRVRRRVSPPVQITIK